MNKTLTALAATLALFAGAAHAEGYVGVGAGVANADVDCEGTTSCDKTGTGAKVFGGYKINKSIAIEGGYLSFGKVTASVPVGGVNVGLTVKPSAFYVGAAFLGDFSPAWTGVARLGVASVKAKIDARAGSVSASDDESKTQAYAGFGVGYRVNPSFTVGADLDFTRAAFDGEEMSVRMLSVTAAFTF